MRSLSDSMLKLPTVTLTTTATRDHENVCDALMQTMDRVSFRNIVVITDKPEVFEQTGAATHKIAPFASFEDMCPWGLTTGARLMVDVIGSHALNIHWDGFVVNPDAWRDEWLTYDFIGAAFDRDSIGNNGFCLASRLYYQSIVGLGLPATVDACYPSDLRLAKDEHAGLVGYKSRMQAQGVQYAPYDVAQEFSRHNEEYSGTFGFHSRITLRSVIDKGLFPRRRQNALWPGEWHTESDRQG